MGGFHSHSVASQNNSNSPLSVVYDRVSPLEQMHCYLLLKLMRLHGLGAFLDKPGYGTHNRRLLWETVLVTDMTLHGQFMDSFKKLLTPELVPLHLRQILTCQAIIKCADISNPVSSIVHSIYLQRSDFTLAGSSVFGCSILGGRIGEGMVLSAISGEPV